MTAPPTPLWRLLLACLPRPTRRVPFIRIPLYEIEERRQRNRILRDPREAILDCEIMGQLSQVAYVLRQRGIEWTEVVGAEKASKMLRQFADEMRDDGGTP